MILGIGVLTACGGGGGGGDDGGSTTREPLTINASNGRRVAVEVVQGSQSITRSGGVLVFAADGSHAHSSLPGVRALTYSLALERLAAGVPLGDVATADSQSLACPEGGTVTINVSDNNGNNQLDAGDSAGLTFDNCAEGGIVQNGTVALKVGTIQGDPNSNSADWSFQFFFGFDNYTISSDDENFGLDGDYALAASYEASTAVFRFATSGSELNFTNNTDRASIADFNFVERLFSAASRFAARYDFVYDAGDFAGSVDVTTNAAFKGIENFPPESGKLTIRGADNTRVVVQATGGGMAKISVDANGDGDFTDSEDRIVEGQWTTFFG